MIHDDILWAQFASAALSSGQMYTASGASKIADDMLKEYKKRWSKHPFKTEETDDTTSHRPTNAQ